MTPAPTPRLPDPNLPPASATQPALGVSALWFQLNQGKSYSLHAFATGQWLRNYLLTQQEPTQLRLFVGAAALGFGGKVAVEPP
ncbi:MAG: hypothetical protein WKG07_47325 [Hymenobacter sp.]